MGTLPSDTSSIAIRGRRDLVESSGVVSSVDQPGVLFMINDSGNDALLFALDTTGVDRGVWRVRGASNGDWEALSAGPCSENETQGSPRSSQRCLYIGDVGDNFARRRNPSIYRVPEPPAGESGFAGEVRAARLIFSYEDRPHDVESMYVGRDGAIHLITKRRLDAAGGQRRPALVFTISPDAWTRATRAVARLTDSLPIVPGSAPLRLITDASLSPDSRFLAVRTYVQLWIFATDTVTGRVVDSIAPTTCNISGLGEPQGEGITWLGASRTLLLTSERRGSPLRVVRCPLPER